MKKWYVYGKKADFQELGEKLSLDPVLVRILRNRDLTTEEDMQKRFHLLFSCRTVFVF